MLSPFVFSRGVQKVNCERLGNVVKDEAGEEYSQHTMVVGGGLFDDGDRVDEILKVKVHRGLTFLISDLACSVLCHRM